MKKIIFILFIFLGNTLAYSQNVFSLAYDVMGHIGSDRGVTIAKMNDGLFLVSGSICDGLIGCFAIIKTDFNGNEQWRVKFDNYPFEIDGPLSAPIMKSNGNYIIGGGIYYNYDPFDARSYLMEFDSLGNIYWQYEYGGTSSNYCYQIASLEDEGFLLYGNKWVNGGKRRYFIKTDSEGNMEWEQTLPLIEGSWSNTVGRFELLENGEILHLVSTQSNLVAEGKALVLLDSELNPIMTKQLNQENLPLNNVANLARKKQGSGYVIPLKVDTIFPGPGIGVNAHVVVGLDSLWNIEWVTPFPTGGRKLIYNMIIAQNGDIIGCGSDDTFRLSDEMWDYAYAGWLFRMSPDGEVIWDRRYVVEENLEWDGVFDLADLVEMDDGRIAAVGLRLDQFPDGAPDGNVWLLMVDENGCLEPGCEEEQIWIAVNEPEGGGLVKSEQLFFKLAPNPATTYAELTFYHPLRENSLVNIYAASGQLIDKKILAKGTKKHEIDISHFVQGTYFITLESNGRILQREKLIVH